MDITVLKKASDATFLAEKEINAALENVSARTRKALERVRKNVQQGWGDALVHAPKKTLNELLDLGFKLSKTIKSTGDWHTIEW